MTIGSIIQEQCRKHLVLPSPSITEFVQQLIESSADSSGIKATLQESGILFSTGVGEEWRFDSADARTLLRLICARLFGIAKEMGVSVTQINPYGGGYKVGMKDKKGSNNTLCVDFLNTPERNEFRIELKPQEVPRANK